MNLTQQSRSLSGRTKTWIAVAVCLAVLLLFFRLQLQNHFAVLSSDRYDGTIQVALLEHWFNVFRGLAHWTSPNYFFPYAKTLSHNEGLFLYGIVYSIFRFFSIDAFLSTELVNMVIKVVGFFGFLIAAQRILKLAFSWALLGAVVFTLSNNTFLQMGHAQLLSVAFAPLEAWLVYEAYEALAASRTRRLIQFGGAAVVFFLAWMMTCLYTAWFFAMLAFITVLVQLCMVGKTGWQRLLRAVVANKLVILGLLAVAVVLLLPFASVYVSADSGVAQRPWEAILDYAPSLFDSVNVGGGNILFGDVIDSVRAGCAMCSVGYGENEAGMSPILFVLAGLCIVGIFNGKVALAPTGKVVLGGIALASAILWLLSLRFGHHSMWYLIYKFWPGGRGLRVVARVLLVLSVPATALAVYYLSQVKWPRVVVLAVCALLVAEQFNRQPITSLDRYKMVDRTSVPPAPATCRAFFTTESPDTDDGEAAIPADFLYPHNVDAMLIAEYVNLPTINGFASFNPPDWNFASPTKPDYLLRVQAYAKAHDLKGLCKFDLISKTWDAQPVYAEGQGTLARWNFRNNAIPPDSLQGFDSIEAFGRWSLGREASFKYTLPEHHGRDPLKVEIILATVLVKDQHVQRVRVFANGQDKGEFVFKGAGRGRIEFSLPASADNTGEIKMQFPDAISPKQLGMGNDDRQLAVGLQSIAIR